MAKVTYTTVGSNKLEEAKKFYDALMESIGVPAIADHPSGGRIYGGADHMFGRRMMDQPANLPTPAQAGDDSFDLRSLMKRPAVAAG